MGSRAELIAAGALALVFFALVAAIVLLQPAPQAQASIHAGTPEQNPPTVRVSEPARPTAAQGPEAGALDSRPETVNAGAAAENPEPNAPEAIIIDEPIAAANASPPESKSVFDTPVLGEFAEVVKTTSVIATGNALLCTSGRLDACGVQSVSVSEKVGNDTVFYPFRDRFLEELETGCARDADDEYTIANYNLTTLYACAANARDIKDIFICSIKFNKENGGMCLSSTSAFKLAYCASGLARQEQPFRLYKAFVADGYNAHRFILLRNENGFYSLDPLWCPSESAEGVEKCIAFSSKSFYDNPEAKNYRGIVEKIDRFA